MNIKDLQIAKAFKEATAFILRRGKTPSFSQINEYAKDKFEKSPAGMPSFKPMMTEKYECSNPNEYNYMLAKIKSDLDDLYDADNFFNNQLISAFNYYDTEKKRIDNMINNVQNRLDNLLDGINEPMSKDSIFDNFDDFSKTDFVGNEDRNITPTSAYVDLLNKVSSSDTDRTKQVSLKDCVTTISVVDTVKSNSMISDVKNCLGDTINQAWIHEVVSDSDAGITVKLIIELPEDTEINTVKYYLHSPREAAVKLYITDASQQVRPLKKISTRNNAEWNFGNIKVKSITFEIFKSEPDAIFGVDSMYYVGAKRIAMFNNTHYTKSVLVSKPYPIKHPFSMVYASMDQILPPQTIIKYFLCVDRGDNQISWMKINDNNYTELDLLYFMKTNISMEYTEGFGRDSSGGYILSTLKYNPVINTSKLYIGNNMWEVHSLELDGDELDLKELVSSEEISYKTMDSTTYPILENTAEMFTTHVNCSKASAVKIIARATSDIIKTYMYVNGIKIEQIDTYFMIRLGVGWNQVQVIYVNEGVESEIYLNAYFNDVADIVRAMKEPAQEVPLSDLFYGVHNKDYKEYSIVENNIIVNYDPIDAGMEASIEYRYTTTPETFEDASIRIMAVFESYSKDVAPKLNNYKIITM